MFVTSFGNMWLITVKPATVGKSATAFSEPARTEMCYLVYHLVELRAGEQKTTEEWVDRFFT